MNDLLHFVKLSLLHVGFAKLDDKWRFKNVISPFVRLFLVTKGNANAYYTNQSFDLKAGYMYLIPSNTYNSYWCDNYHEQYYTGFFEEVKLGMSIFELKKFRYEVEFNEYDLNLFKRLLKINPNIFIIDSTPKSHLKKSFLTSSSVNKSSLNHAIETQGILTILLSRFIEDVNVETSGDILKGDFSTILNYIAKNIKGDITISDLAKFTNLSNDHFSRVFKSKFDITPNKYIQLKRIERAQFLLLTTNYSLEEIAERVGLNNMSYFSRKFKEITKTTPHAFRKQRLIN